MKVRGRGKLTGSIARDQDGALVIRLDDDTRPAFWAELIVSADELREALPRRPAEEPAVELHVTEQQFHTILAALRFYQANCQGDPDNHSEAIHELAANSDEVLSLDEAGIDRLCERINLGYCLLPVRRKEHHGDLHRADFQQ